jgi:replicative DNA helicase
LRAKGRRLKAEKDIGMIIIDYLQLMQGNVKAGGNREQEIAGISRSLKELAKELDVPIIALSQLSRAVETRGGDKKPMLSDLRESGSIEQDADMVMFLYRPEYYGLTTYEDGSSTQGVAEVIIAKQRSGPVGDVRLRFINQFAKFANLEEYGVDPFAAMANNNSGGGSPGTITRPSKMNDMGDDSPVNFDFPF